MANEGKTSSRQLLIRFAFLTAVATMILDAPFLQFQQLEFWAQIAVPALLVAGVFGSARDIRLLRLLGWIGICAFILFGLNFVIAGEEFIAGGPDGAQILAPRFEARADLLLRLGVWLILSMLLAWCYLKLSRGKRLG